MKEVLTPLHKIVSSEPVLTSEIAGLIRKVADHYAGTFADVMRLAVPPRHAATERAERARTDRSLPMIIQRARCWTIPLAQGSWLRSVTSAVLARYGK